MSDAFLSRALNLAVVGLIGGAAAVALVTGYGGFHSLLAGQFGTGTGLIALSGALATGSYQLVLRRNELTDA